MAHSSKSGKSGTMNTQPPHTAEDDRADDRWKTSPGTEVTGDQGENARRARERKVEENTPGKGPRPSRSRE